MTFTASLNGTSATGQVKVAAPVIKSIITKSGIYGLQNSTGTVVIGSPAPTGGLTVTLSSNSSYITVPASVNIAAGAIKADFPITTGDPPISTLVTISGTLNGVKITHQTGVLPNTITSLSFSPSSVQGSSTKVVAGTVFLKAPVISDVVVTLHSANAHATVPDTVTIPAGSRYANFVVGHTAVTTSTTVIIKASRLGASLSAGLTLTP